MLYNSDYLADIAHEEGGVRQLLNKTWRKGYQANAPRNLLSNGEVRGTLGSVGPEDYPED